MKFIVDLLKCQHGMYTYKLSKELKTYTVQVQVQYHGNEFCKFMLQKAL